MVTNKDLSIGKYIDEVATPDMGEYTMESELDELGCGEVRFAEVLYEGIKASAKVIFSAIVVNEVEYTINNDKENLEKLEEYAKRMSKEHADTYEEFDDNIMFTGDDGEDVTIVQGSDTYPPVIRVAGL
jgi:hypothetical protein